MLCQHLMLQKVLRKEFFRHNPSLYQFGDFCDTILMLSFSVRLPTRLSRTRCCIKVFFRELAITGRTRLDNGFYTISVMADNL